MRDAASLGVREAFGPHGPVPQGIHCCAKAAPRLASRSLFRRFPWGTRDQRENLTVLVHDNDVQMSRFLVPPLTTVAQLATEIGGRAVELLIDLIDRKAQSTGASTTHVIVAPTLKVRGSTAAPTKGGELRRSSV